ncbi:MAG: hypothetical protein HYZ23_08995 [Chloroflexi bacterium]|nr:hypothetical protein [Chloroflexota bacterium]
MPTLKTIYMMAFTPAKMDNNMLMGVCKMAADRLSAKDRAFAQRMELMTRDTRITLSNQLHISTMHTPQVMQNTLGGWLKNENVPFDPVPGDTFFAHGLKDPKGMDNFFLFYFHMQ